MRSGGPALPKGGIDEERSDFRRLRVAVRPGFVRMPDECLLCGEKQYEVLPIRQSATAIFGGFVVEQSVEVSVPLCREHRDAYLGAVRKRSALMVVSFLAGIALCVLSQILFPSSPTEKEPVGLVMMLGAGVALIVAAFAFMLAKDAAFPIKMGVRRTVLFVGRLYYCLRFPNEESIQRFLAANGVERRKS